MKTLAEKLKTKLDWINYKQRERIIFNKKENIEFNEGLFSLEDNVLSKEVDNVKTVIGTLTEDNYPLVFDRLRKKLEKEIKLDRQFDKCYNGSDVEQYNVKDLYSGTATITKKKDIVETKPQKLRSYKKEFRSTDIVNGRY